MKGIPMTDKFVQAKNFTPTNGRQIDLSVIHDMEASEENLNTAENIANWFAGKNAPRASAHWCHDQDSSVRGVHDKDVAWAAPGANNNGIQHEMAGYARQTRDEWLDGPSLKILERTAAKVKVECMTYGYKPVFVNADGLLRGHRGITTHLEVSRAFRRSTHWDPGYHFPIDVFISMVNGTKVTAPPAPTPVALDPKESVLKVGSEGPAVEGWQKILVGAGHKIKVDGKFGPVTEAATKDFQGKLNVTADGKVGPQTRAAVARLFAWLAAQKNKTASSGSHSYPPLPGVMKVGSRGDGVKLAQKRLSDRGWKIAVDGIFGNDTKGVVLSFQKDKGLNQDGIIGKNTWAAMWLSPVT